MLDNLLRKIRNPVFVRTSLPVLIFLFLLFGNLIFAKVAISFLSEANDGLTKTKEEVATLIQKEATLKEISEGILPISEVTLVAVPGANPALSVSAQLRSLAYSHLVSFSGVTVSAPILDGNLSKVAISFAVSGGVPNIVNFFSKTGETLPLLVFDNLSIKNSFLATEGTANISVYWANLPSSIPGVSQLVSPLLPEDIELIGKLGGRERPTFIQIPAQAPSLSRPDPFK